LAGGRPKTGREIGRENARTGTIKQQATTSCPSPPAAVFEDDKLIELGGKVEPPVLKPGANGVEVVPEKSWIKHGASAVCP